MGSVRENLNAQMQNDQKDFEDLIVTIKNKSFSNWEDANDLLHKIFGMRAHKPMFDYVLKFQDLSDKRKVKEVIDVSCISYMFYYYLNN